MKHNISKPTWDIAKQVLRGNFLTIHGHFKKQTVSYKLIENVSKGPRKARTKQA